MAETAKAERRSGRFLQFAAWWTALAVVAWFVLFLSVGDQSHCYEGDWICFEPWQLAVLTAITVAVPRLTGLFVGGIVAGLVRWHKKLSRLP